MVNGRSFKIFFRYTYRLIESLLSLNKAFLNKRKSLCFFDFNLFLWKKETIIAISFFPDTIYLKVLSLRSKYIYPMPKYALTRSRITISLTLSLIPNVNFHALSLFPFRQLCRAAFPPWEGE